MTRSEIQNRIAEIDRRVNTEVAGSKLPMSGMRRSFPTMTWIVAAAAFAWHYYGTEIPAGAGLHQQYGAHAFYVGTVLAAVAAWGTILYLIQPRPRITQEYRDSTQRVRMLQEERRELMIRLRELEQGAGKQ